MLYSVVLNLIAEEDAELSPTQGYHSYALLLSLIREVAPKLSEQLHSMDGPKPFTVSPLRGKFGPRDRKVNAGSTYWLRFTFLDDSLFPYLTHSIMNGARDGHLRLGAAVFKLGEIVTHPQGSRWAAFDRFEDIAERASDARRISLEFSSPTAFRSGGKRNVVFPIADLVFGSLLAAWNARSGIAFDQQLKDCVSDHVIPARYRLETRLLDFGTYQEVGFQGRCTFLVSESAPEESVRQMNCLADFAFYAGVGAKTTMGMGQTRRIDARPLPWKRC